MSLAILLFANLAKAQYPVQIIPQLVSPYTLNLTDYYTGTSPKVFITLTNRDLLRPTVSVRLSLIISGQLATISTRTVGSFVTINLDAGVPKRLSMSDLEPYFNPANLDFTGSLTKAQYLTTNRLPEGYYNFCFQAIEMNTNRVVSENVCSNVWISLSDPPLLSTPSNAAILVPTQVPNMLFNWTPRHLNSPNGAFNTNYELEIKEIRDNVIDPQAAFQSAPQFFNTTVEGTSFTYGPSQPVLLNGVRYAWRVRVKAKNLADDRDDFKNNGWSDVFWFIRRTPCPVPSNYIVTNLNETSISLGWTNGQNVTQNAVEYRQTKPSLGAWVKVPNTFSNPININDLNPGSTYEYKVASSCSDNNLDYGLTREYTVPALATNTSLGSNNVKVRGKVTWAYLNKGETTPTSTTSLVADVTENSRKDCNVPKDETGTTKFNLPNARVVINSISGSVKTEIGSGFTDASGSYVINVPQSKVIIDEKQPTSSFEIVVTPDKKFSTTRRTDVTTSTTYPPNFVMVRGRGLVTIPGFTRTELNSSANHDITTFVNNFEYEPRITSNDVATAKSSGLKIDILLLESDWLNGYSKLPISLGKVTKGKDLYNNQNYVVLETISNNINYTQLLQGYKYVAKIYSPTTATIYTPITEASAFCKMLDRYNISFFTTLTGTVKCGTSKMSNANVKLTINEKDIVGSSATAIATRVVETKTNTTGAYSFSTLPRIKPGSTINVEVSALAVRKETFALTTKLATAASDVFDINLVHEVFTYTGRLIDQNSKPIANALIEVDGNKLDYKTGDDGFFLFQTSHNPNKTIKFTANGYVQYNGTLSAFVPSATNTKAKMYNLAANSNQKTAWTSQIQNVESVNKFALANGASFVKTTQVNGKLFGWNNFSIGDLYETVIAFAGFGTMKGLYDVEEVVMSSFNESAWLNIELANKKIAANVVIKSLVTPAPVTQGGSPIRRGWGAPAVAPSTPIETTVATLTSQVDKTLVFSAASGKYKFYITPINEVQTFVPFSGEFTLTTNTTTAGANKVIKVTLTDAVIVRGTIKNIVKNTTLDTVAIKVDGLPYMDTSKNKGTYQMYLPRNTSMKLVYTCKGFATKDTTIKPTTNLNSFNINLKPFEERLPVITKIAGFKVDISKIERIGQTNEFTVSGKFILDSLSTKNVFVPKAGNTTLNFKNAKVTATFGVNNAIPTQDLLFEEATLEAKAYGFDVELQGKPQLKLAKLRVTSLGYANAVIGCNKITLKANNDGVIKFENAVLKDALVTQNDNAFHYVFSAPGVAVDKSLTDEKEYKVDFVDNKNVSDVKVLGHPNITKALLDTFTVASIAPTFSLFIKKKEVEFKKDGLSMEGYFQMPKQFSTTITNNGKVQLKKFKVNSAFKPAEITFDIGETKALTMNLQKIKATLTSINISGLDTKNFGFGFGGTIYLKETTKGKVDAKEALTIEKFNIVNKPEGLSLEGSFKLPKDGISIKNLVFKGLGETTIDMEYDFAEKSFKLDAAGILDYNGTNTSKAIKSVFPIEIQKFKLSTADWSLLLVAKANVKIDLKVCKINVTKFLVNIGSNVSTTDMLKLLKATTTPAKVATIASAAEQTLEEDKTNWAFGLTGGVEFGLKDLKVDANGTILVSNISGSVGVIVDELNLKIDGGKQFQLSGKVGMSFGGEKQGFEAQVDFNTLSTGFKAGFKYYSFDKGGFELAANITASVGQAAVVTGPIQWFSIGGGFSLNTATNVYEVYVNGEATTSGTPKNVAYLKIAKLGILFDVNKCGGVPVVTGDGELFVKNESWGKINATLDFCAMTVAITVDGKVPVNPAYFLPVKGVLFGMAPKDGREGALFFNVNAEVDLFSGWVKGNAVFALGVNYDNNHPLAPQAAKAAFTTISNEAKDGNKFNAVYLSASLTVPKRSGDYSLTIAGFSAASFKYDISIAGSYTLFYKFSTNTFIGKATLDASFSGKAQILTFSVVGSASINGALNGGYDNNWFLNGNLRVKVSVGVGSSGTCYYKPLNYHNPIQDFAMEYIKNDSYTNETLEANTSYSSNENSISTVVYNYPQFNESQSITQQELASNNYGYTTSLSNSYEYGTLNTKSLALVYGNDINGSVLKTDNNSVNITKNDSNHYVELSPDGVLEAKFFKSLVKAVKTVAAVVASPIVSIVAAVIKPSICLSLSLDFNLRQGQSPVFNVGF
ncbi:MAG: hypothetical protein ACOVMM_12910 [Chitinophagaceae bacterium]